jgi:uncharacterized protein (DUF488 family)
LAEFAAARAPRFGNPVLEASMRIFTVGHSTRSSEEFLALLRAHGIGRLVDVRRYPGSRRYPHFSRDALAATLAEAGIEYVHAPGLGGRREAAPDSRNGAWRSAAFRGYADHMTSSEFQAWLQRLVAWSTEGNTAIMCAEALPWRCHRQLIADALVARGIEVMHISDPARTQKHLLNPHAVVADDGAVTYPPRQGDVQATLPLDGE